MDATTNHQHQHQDGSPMQQPPPPSKKRKQHQVKKTKKSPFESAPKKKKRILKSFEQRIADLREYKEMNGHVNVKYKDDKSLYDFCYNIRKVRKNPEKSTDRKLALTDDRIASLDALGFEWSDSGTKSLFEQRKHLLCSTGRYLSNASIYYAQAVLI